MASSFLDIGELVDNQTFPLIAAIRGAIQIPSDSSELITSGVQKLYASLLKENDLDESQIAMILITQTDDLRSMNPAASLRKGGYAHQTPLFCMQELGIDGMLERVIRVMLVTNAPLDHKAMHVYLDGAEKLRPDLALK